MIPGKMLLTQDQDAVFVTDAAGCLSQQRDSKQQRGTPDGFDLITLLTDSVVHLIWCLLTHGYDSQQRGIPKMAFDMCLPMSHTHAGDPC